LLQYNWYKIQEYQQNDLTSLTKQLFGSKFHKLSIQYYPKKEEARATLNFHLTQSEKLDLTQTLDNPYNSKLLREFQRLLNPIPEAPPQLTKAGSD
ncbi:MAG TPA: hypothetical protein VEV87_02820, partial [Chitinophagaceae bacterium]|nr:hypothetical protein [Chitinophagaceae bacterium]